MRAGTVVVAGTNAHKRQSGFKAAITTLYLLQVSI
jgi:hypothetical protein